MRSIARWQRMASNYEQLVKALRCKRDDCEGCDLAFFDKDEGWMCQYAAKDDDAADAIEALEKQIDSIENEKTNLEADIINLEIALDKANTQLPKRGDFEKQLHSMFDHIWDCEIDHPMFQDTVGELMEAVLQAFDGCGAKTIGEQNVE